MITLTTRQDDTAVLAALLRPSYGTVTATVRRDCGPEGWLQGNKVTDDDDVLADTDRKDGATVVTYTVEPDHPLSLAGGIEEREGQQFISLLLLVQYQHNLPVRYGSPLLLVLLYGFRHVACPGQQKPKTQETWKIEIAACSVVFVNCNPGAARGTAVWRGRCRGRGGGSDDAGGRER